MTSITKTGKSPIPVRKPAPMKSAAAKAAAKPSPKAAAPAVAALPVPARVVAAPRADKPKKSKLVRDSFTIPKAEYAVLQDLKQRAGKGGIAAKKSEILRAGIKALAAMDDAAFITALGVVPAIKTGRPARE